MADPGRARAVVDELLDRLAASPPEIFTSTVSPAALHARADDLDALTAAGTELPLHGVPFAVKDNIDVAGVPTTAAVPEYAYTPAANARAVQRLLDAGGICVGKTNLDQFATGLSGTRSPHFGIPRNPLNPEYIAGGSSSGSAVAVASGLVPLALGTDTAGSGRVPAACCGIVGLKPTRASVSTTGLVPASPSFDTVSLFATNCADAALGFDVMAEDAGACERPSRERARVAVPRTIEWFGDFDARRCYEAAITRLDAQGVALHEIDLDPFLEAGNLLYGSALLAERYASFGEFVRAHPDAIDPASRELVLASADHTAPDAFRAIHRLTHLRDATSPTWDSIDAIVLPTIARHPTVDHAVRESIATSRELGTYTAFVNLLDLAAIAVPAGKRNTGLPFGITFVGAAWSDHVLLALAATFTGAALPEPAAVHDVRIAVVGAHLQGQPLNHQLTDLGARLVTTTTTSPAYRFYALALDPPKPGMVRDAERGAAIELEVWSLSAEGFGRFVANVPAPLTIGSVELADGSRVPGFLCEPFALATAREITALGGWRAYLSGATS
jgi:allophanate hydrolase